MLVTVNRVVIPDYEIERESAEVDVQGVDARREAAAQQLVVRELLSQRARELGLDTEEDLDAAIDRLMDSEIDLPEIDDADCRRYFEANRERFHAPVRVELRHILLAARPDDIDSRAAAEARAGDLLAMLQAHPSAFEELASSHSACPSATDGGYLGLIGSGQAVPEFEDVVLRLEPGLAPRAVETRYGFHVVEVLSREGGEPLPYEAVSGTIAEYIRERAWRRAVSQYIAQLAAAAEIQGVGIEIPDSPLLQ